MQRAHRGPYDGHLGIVEPPTLIRGQHTRRVGDQRALLRPHLRHQLQERRVGIAFDVEFEAGPPRTHQLGQREDVVAPDVALIRSWMHGQPVRAGRMGERGEAEQVGHAGSASVAQQGDLVEVDAQACHGGFSCSRRKVAKSPSRETGRIGFGFPRSIAADLRRQHLVAQRGHARRMRTATETPTWHRRRSASPWAIPAE